MTASDFLPEEDWESDISALLGGLPNVAPPDGFITEALDHRPLHAGRLVAGLGAAVFVAFGVAIGLGGFGQSSVVPELSALNAQHAAASAGGLGTASYDSDDESADDAVEVAPNLDLQARIVREEDLRQAVYDVGGDQVSIFSQPGVVDFDELPSGTIITIEGVTAWEAADDNVVVLQTADYAVTIIGLEPAEVERAIADIPGQGTAAAVGRLVNEFTSQLGFPDLP